MGDLPLPPTRGRAWAVFCTGPHVGWYARGFYQTRKSAVRAASGYRRDGFSDGVCVVRVDFAEPYMNWVKLR